MYETFPSLAELIEQYDGYMEEFASLAELEEEREQVKENDEKKRVKELEDIIAKSKEHLQHVADKMVFTPSTFLAYEGVNGAYGREISAERRLRSRGVYIHTPSRTWGELLEHCLREDQVVCPRRFQALVEWGLRLKGKSCEADKFLAIVPHASNPRWNKAVVAPIAALVFPLDKSLEEVAKSPFFCSLALHKPFAQLWIQCEKQPVLKRWEWYVMRYPKRMLCRAWTLS